MRWLYSKFRELTCSIEQKIKEVHNTQSICQYQKIESQTCMIKSMFKSYLILLNQIERLSISRLVNIIGCQSLILNIEVKKIENDQCCSKTLVKLPMVFLNTSTKGKEIKSVLKKVKSIIQNGNRVFKNHEMVLKLAFCTFNINFSKIEKLGDLKASSSAMIDLSKEIPLEFKSGVSTKNHIEDIKAYPSFDKSIQQINEINPQPKRVKVLREAILIMKWTPSNDFELLSYNISCQFKKDLRNSLLQSMQQQSIAVNGQHQETVQ